jgi:hypothetical protein
VILTKYNRELAHQMVDSAPDGHVIEVKPAKRSLEQNRLYWAILSDISEQVVNGNAFEPSIWHVYFKQLFLPDHVHELPDGSIKMLEPSTAELKLDEFSEYVDKVTKWAVEHEVKLSEKPIAN